MKTVRIFISSVQKELELERATVAGLISTDPFMKGLGLIELGLLELVGKGRAVRYVAKTTDNRPTQS